MTSEVPKKEATTPNKRLGNAGKGRPKGVPNKTPSLIKDMIAQALDKAGGVDYLTECANNPRTASAFLGLVGKVLPMTLTGPDGGAVQTVTRIELVAMSGDKAD